MTRTKSTALPAILSCLLPNAVFALSQLCLKKDRPKLLELELWTEISTLSASNVRTVDTFSILVRRVLSVGPSGTMCFVINAIEEGKARVSQREMTRGKIDKN